jgi:hypothetical protein
MSLSAECIDRPAPKCVQGVMFNTTAQADHTCERRNGTSSLFMI